MSGNKPAFKTNEIDEIDHPTIDECGWKYFKEFVYRYDDVLMFHPDRFHRKGELKGKIILDDINFSANMCAKVRKNE